MIAVKALVAGAAAVAVKVAQVRQLAQPNTAPFCKLVYTGGEAR